MPGAAPLHWRQVAAHAAALLLLIAPAAAAAASDAGFGDLAGAAAAGVGAEAPRRQLLASGSAGAGGIAGIVLGMALLAAAVGGLCFVLGRRSARAPALTTAAAAAGDIEVGLLSGAAPAKPRPRAMSFAGVRQMVAGERGPREGRAAFAMAAADRGGPTASSSYHSQCSLASSDGKGRCIACDGHELNNAAANRQMPNANGRVPARSRPSSDVADVITGRFASQSVRDSGPHMAIMEGIDLEIQSWFVDASEIEFCRRPDGSDWLLGEGSYGKVYKALRNGVQEVAVKVLLCTDEDQLNAFQKEIGILKSISYDRNIVQFYGACLKSATNEPMLLLEYCEGGDVRRALTADREQAEATALERRLGWYAAGQHIALDVARGLHFLHKSGVTHGDMKAQNVLITGRWAKITDVGVARVMTAPEQLAPEVTLGTFAYAAPEMLLGADWDYKADIYSFGVVLWEICTGQAPARGQLRAPEVPEECPASIAALIKECMSGQPEKRPTAKEIFDRMQAEAVPVSNPPPSPPASPFEELTPAHSPETALANNPAAPNIREMMLRREHSSLSAASGGHYHGGRSRTSSACGSPEYKSGRRSPPPFAGSMLSTSSAGSPLGSRNTSGLSAAAASLESGALLP